MAARKSSSGAEKTSGASGSREVDAWFAKLDHPQKATMLAVRRAPTKADSRLGECMQFDVQAKTAALRKIVKAWCDARAK